MHYCYCLIEKPYCSRMTTDPLKSTQTYQIMTKNYPHKTKEEVKCRLSSMSITFADERRKRGDTHTKIRIFKFNSFIGSHSMRKQQEATIDVHQFQLCAAPRAGAVNFKLYIELTFSDCAFGFENSKENGK